MGVLTGKELMEHNKMYESRVITYDIFYCPECEHPIEMNTTTYGDGGICTRTFACTACECMFWVEVEVVKYKHIGKVKE